MVPETTASTTGDRSPTTSETLINAVIGAAAAVILSSLPLSTLLGGAIAAYLEGGTPSDGIRVGAIAGLLMFVPFLLIGIFFGSVLFTGSAFVPMGGGRPRTPIGIIAIFMGAVGLIYTIGFSAVGGYLGNYLEGELGGR